MIIINWYFYFQGVLLDSRQIAVKKLSKTSGQGTIEFKNEIVLIAKLQHRNLVTLYGFCSEEQEKMLVYEYVPNKSLDYFLFGKILSIVIHFSLELKIHVYIIQLVYPLLICTLIKCPMLNCRHS